MTRLKHGCPHLDVGAATGKPDRRAQPAGVPLVNAYEVGRRRRLVRWGATVVLVCLAFAVGSEWGWSRRVVNGVRHAQPDSRVARLLPIAGEFEAQSAIILNAGFLLGKAPDIFEKMVAAITRNVHLICLVGSAEQRADARAVFGGLGLSNDDVTLLLLPLNSSWVRDYGPIFLCRENGSVSIADLRYNIDTDSPGREKRWLDDRLPEVFGGLFSAPVQDVPLCIEGGNMLSNGEGLCLTTDIGSLGMRDFIQKRSKITDDDVLRVGQELRDRLGFKHWTPLPILPEEITGHVDMFATFTAPDSVVVAQCEPAVNLTDAEILDKAAARLAKVMTDRGPMRVTRVPMPSRAKNGGYRSYTNVLYVNGTLLVPSFEDVEPEIERYVADTYTRLLPGWEIIPIPVGSEVADLGYFHCMTKNIPACVPLPDLSRVGK